MCSMEKILITTILLSVIACQKDQNKNAEKPHSVPALSSDAISVPSSAISQPIQASTQILSTTALQFINAYLEEIKNSKDAKMPFEWVYSSNLASAAFKTSLRKIIADANQKDPELGLDFDPILDAQDYPDEGFIVESTDPQEGQVVVIGKDMPALRITIRLVQQDTDWVVDGCGVVNMSKDKTQQ